MLLKPSFAGKDRRMDEASGNRRYRWMWLLKSSLEVSSLFLFGLVLFGKYGWRHVELFGKAAAEIFWVGEAHFVCHVGYGVFAALQKRGGIL